MMEFFSPKRLRLEAAIFAKRLHRRFFGCVLNTLVDFLLQNFNCISYRNLSSACKKWKKKYLVITLIFWSCKWAVLLQNNW